MIKDLQIKNFALIDDISVEFKEGFNVITGETGAGKTLLLSALKFILGENVTKTYIRKGKQQADIQVILDIQKYAEIQKKIEDLSIDFDDEIIIRRILNQQGKNRVFLNDKLISVKKLKDLLSPLVQISSQHQNQKLLDKNYQRSILDSFSKVDKELAEYTKIYGILKKKILDYKSLQESSAQERLQKINFLKFKLKDLKSLALEKNDVARITEEYNLINEWDKRNKSFNELKEVLLEGDLTLGQLNDKILSTINNIKEFNDFKSIFEEISVLIQKAETDLYNLSKDKNIFSEERIEELSEQYNAMEEIFSRYAIKSEDDYFSTIDKLSEEVKILNNITKEKEKLAKEISNLKENCRTIANKISLKRKKAAGKLAKDLSDKLHLLAMEEAEVKVEVLPQEKLGAYGFDQINYLIASNKGLDFNSIDKVASGGELSRISLVMQILSSTKNQILIFDEIDAGIGGEVALKIGDYLNGLSGNNQILCVSHNAQVAAFANNHYSIFKESDSSQTNTFINELSKKNRAEELARMLSGQVNKKSLSLARELLSTYSNN